MTFARLNTPSARLRMWITPGVLALLVVVVWAMQPASGFTLNIAAWRPLQIHPAIWVSLGVGFSAYLISIWIWTLKPLNPATRLFALSGVMTLLFTFAATRGFMEAALPENLLSALRTTNLLAASGFGIVMICLFLIYPGQLPFWRWIMGAVIVFFGMWTLVRGFGPWRNPNAVQPITFFEMTGIVLFAFGQILAARHDPRQRAIAVWLGASVLLGAGGFIAMVSVPSLFGRPVLMIPQYAFASFLLIYAGLALGLIRYRLFDLGGWAFQLIFHAGVALVVLAVDTSLIGGLLLASPAALGLVLFGMAFLYMPLREQAWRLLTQNRKPDEAAIFHKVMETALKPNGQARAQGWERLLRDIYRPLEVIATDTEVTVPRIETEGLDLYLPPVIDSAALILRYPHAGRSLFTQRDLATAEQIIALMRHAEESRSAYDRGVSEERTRIARDIHDNIGAQLLRALHSKASERKDAMIRDTLADLRDVINNAQHTELSLALALADLRAETADRLSPHKITLEWQIEATADVPLPPSRMHVVRSLVREATSNTIKYAAARTLSVAVSLDASELSLRIEDDGRGFDSDAVAFGHGLDNMKARAESLNGSFRIDSTRSGTCLMARIPLPPEAASA